MDIRVVDVEYNDDDGYDVHAYLKVSEDTTEEDVEDYLYDRGDIEVYVNGFETLNVKNADKYKDYDFVTFVDEPDESIFEELVELFGNSVKKKKLANSYMLGQHSDGDTAFNYDYGSGMRGNIKKLTKEAINTINSIMDCLELDALCIGIYKDKDSSQSWDLDVDTLLEIRAYDYKTNNREIVCDQTVPGIQEAKEQIVAAIKARSNELRHQNFTKSMNDLDARIKKRQELGDEIERRHTAGEATDELIKEYQNL